MRRFVKLNSRGTQNGGYAGADGAIATNGRVCGRALKQKDFASPPEALQLLGEEPLEFESGMESIRQTLRADKLDDEVERNTGCASRLTMMLCRLNYPPVIQLPLLERQISTGRFALDDLRDNFSDSDFQKDGTLLESTIESKPRCKTFKINYRNAYDDLS